MEPFSRHPARARLRRTIRWMCAGYLLFGAVWILLSDTILQRIGGEWISVPAVHIAKGLDFIVLSSALLYLALRHVRWLGAQERMQESEARYQAIFERSLDCVFLTDLEGRFVDANPAALDLLGYEREEMETLDYRAVIAPEDLPRAFAELRELIQTSSQAKTTEYTLRRKDGSLVDVESESSLVYAGDVPYAIQGIVRDVTERKCAERALRESELRFRQMANAIGQTFWLAPPDYQSILYISPAFERIWGRTCADLYAEPTLWLEAMHPDDRPAVLQALEAVAQGHPYSVDFRIMRPDGTERWVNDRGYAVLDEKGEPMLTAGVSTDITDRRISEMLLRETRDKLREAIRSAELGYWEWDIAAGDVHYSPEWKALLGLEDAEVAQTHAEWESRLHPDDRERVRSRIREQIAGRDADFEFEFRILHRNGGWRWMLSRGSIHRGPAAEPLRMAGFDIDITERKHVEQELGLAAKVFEHSHEGIMICDPDNRLLSVNRAFTAITGYDEEDVLGATPRMLQSGRQGPEFYEQMWQALTERGHWQGELWNRRKSGELFAEWLAITDVRDQSGALTHRVGIFSDISERKESEAQIRHLAQFDLLTGLPNRALLTDRAQMALARAERHGGGVALLFMDLDRFKLVNDSLGHEIGDKLLQAVAERLGRVLRRSDTLSRHGGDEFLVLLTQIDEPEAAGRVATQLLAETARPYRIDDYELVIGASIGIATFPENGADMTTLLRNADAAMYAAKAAGRNRHRFFSEDMNARALERLEIERDLRAAIDRDEFFLVYQPQVELETGRVSGVEALVRWRHHRLGVVSPARFIPVAEESGLILVLGEWVMRAACRQLADWKRRGILDVPIAVNVSAPQFQQSDFLGTVSQILVEEELAASDLELEVTESAVMPGADAMVDRLRALEQYGLRLAIDDFGTGYSSLSYLRHFPFHRLKIDQSFVRDLPGDPSAAAIARAIVAMGGSLSLSVVAEGVEKQAQADFLRSIHCRDAQGFLFCRPLVAEEFEKWLAGRPPHDAG